MKRLIFAYAYLPGATQDEHLTLYFLKLPSWQIGTGFCIVGLKQRMMVCFHQWKIHVAAAWLTYRVGDHASIQHNFFKLATFSLPGKLIELLVDLLNTHGAGHWGIGRH